MDDSLRYSTDKVAIVREARKRGIADPQILTALCRSEVASERRRIIREWAPALGLTEDEAIALARAAGLVTR